MADQLNTAAGAFAAIIPEQWSNVYTTNLRAARPLTAAVARTYENEVQVGDTVRIPTWADGTANFVVDGQAVDAQSTDTSTQSLVVDKIIAYDEIVTKLADLQSFEYMNMLRDRTVNAIMTKIETYLHTLVSPSTSAPDHVIDIDTGTTLVVADILEAKDLLDTQNVALEGRKLICGTSQMNDLLTLDPMVNSDYGNGATGSVNGFLSKPSFGFDLASTTIAGNTAILFHPSFLQMAIQQDMEIKVDDLSSQGIRGHRVSSTLIMGAKQIDNTRVVKLS